MKKIIIEAEIQQEIDVEGIVVTNDCVSHTGTPVTYVQLPDNIRQVFIAGKLFRNRDFNWIKYFCP